MQTSEVICINIDEQTVSIIIILTVATNRAFFPIERYLKTRAETPIFTNNSLHDIIIMHLSMSNRRGWGGRRGIGRYFDIFQKIAVKFPIPGKKREVKYN